MPAFVRVFFFFFLFECEHALFSTFLGVCVLFCFVGFSLFYTFLFLFLNEIGSYYVVFCENNQSGNQNDDNSHLLLNVFDSGKGLDKNRHGETSLDVFSWVYLHI